MYLQGDMLSEDAESPSERTAIGSGKSGPVVSQISGPGDHARMSSGKHCSFLLQSEYHLFQCIVFL